MIVDQADREKNFDTNMDLFSMAGRAALVGGGIYAIDKTDFNSDAGRVFRQRSNKLKTNLASLMEKSTKAPREQESPFKTFKSRFRTAGSFSEDIITAKERGLNEVIDLLDGGFKGNSKGLGNSLQGLFNKMSQVDGSAPTIKYYKRGDQVTQVQLTGANGRPISIPIVSKEGMTVLGSNRNSSYATRGVWRHSMKGEEYIGADVAETDAYARHYSPDMNPRDIREKYSVTRFYDDNNTMIRNNSNPELIGNVTHSYIIDPDRPVNSGTLKRIMREKAISNEAISSASDISKGILHRADAPIHNRPYQTETPDPKKTIRQGMHKNADGSTTYLKNKNVLFMDDEFYEALRETARGAGVGFGEIASDQFIANGANNGNIVTKLRSLSVSGDKIGHAGEFFLSQLADHSGKTPEEVTELLEKGGLANFSEDTQKHMRSLKLDSYRDFLFEQKKQLEDAYNLEINEKFKATDVMGKFDGSINQGAFDEIHNKYLGQINEMDRRIGESHFMGKKSDHIRDAIIKPGMGSSLIDDIGYSNGRFTFDLRVDKALGSGDKLYNSSGEAKAIVKGSVGNLSELLIETQKKLGREINPDIIERFKNVNLVTVEGAIKGSLESRTAQALLYAAKEKARVEHGDLFDYLQDYHKNFNKLDQKGREEAFDVIKRITGQSIEDYVHQKVGGSIFKDLEVAVGDVAADMGSGGKASFSARHLENFQAMGLNDFSEEILANRTNHNVVAAAIHFERTQDLVKDKKFSGLNINSLNDLDMENLFSKSEDITDFMKSRSSVLSKMGVEGNAVLDLGMEIKGQSKIMLLNGADYYGISGSKIGSNMAEGSRLSVLDEATYKLMKLAKDPIKDQKKLERAYDDYHRAITMARGTLAEGFFKGKVKNSLYGMVTSGVEGLEEYEEAMRKFGGVADDLPNIGVVSNKDFTRMFGEDKFREIMEQGKKSGRFLGGKAIGAKDFFMPNAFGIVTREPVEGLSHMAMGILPSGLFGSKVEDGQFSVLRGTKHRGWDLMKLLFGDSDGDHVSVLAANGAKSSKELEELTYGNTERAKAYRQAQRMKGEIDLKARAKYGLDELGKEKGMLSVSEEARREAIFLQKQAEKGNIGIISNAMKPGHNAVRSLAANSSDIADLKKYLNVSNTLHFVAEFTLKGKWQTLEDLQTAKGMQLVEQLTGTGNALSLSADERKLKALSMMDEMRMGEGGHAIANKMRQGIVDDEVTEFLRKGNLNLTPDSDYFKSFGNVTNISDTIDAISEGSKMGDTAEDVLRFAKEGVDSSDFKGKAKREAITSTIESLKDIGMRGGKNLLKYAIAPAAAIGLIGTLAGSQGEIRDTNGPKEYSDGQARHFGTGHTKKPMIQPQMRRPKYEQISITGQTNEASFDENSIPDRANVRIEDNRKNFDKYEIQEIVERGI